MMSDFWGTDRALYEEAIKGNQVVVDTPSTRSSPLTRSSTAGGSVYVGGLGEVVIPKVSKPNELELLSDFPAGREIQSSPDKVRFDDLMYDNYAKLIDLIKRKEGPDRPGSGIRRDVGLPIWDQVMRNFHLMKDVLWDTPQEYWSRAGAESQIVKVLGALFGNPDATADWIVSTIDQRPGAVLDVLITLGLLGGVSKLTGPAGPAAFLGALIGKSLTAALQDAGFSTDEWDAKFDALRDLIEEKMSPEEIHVAVRGFFGGSAAHASTIRGKKKKKKKKINRRTKTTWNTNLRSSSDLRGTSLPGSPTQVTGLDLRREKNG
jgi:hypothetical protein